MRITCPSCEASYQVPETAMRPGRSVRCARCGNNWAPMGEAEPETAEATSPPPPLEPPAPMAMPAPFTNFGPSEPTAFEADSEPARVSLWNEPAPDSIAQVAARESPADAAPPLPSFPPITEWPEDTAKPPSNLNAGLAWVASILVCVIMVWAAVHWREPIMGAWPPSVRVYAALGLA